MNDQVYSSTPIFVIPGTPPERIVELPPPQFNQNDFSQGWTVSSPYLKGLGRRFLVLISTQRRTTDQLSLQIPNTYQFHPAQGSPYLTSPISPSSSAHSLSPSGLASALNDFSLGDQWPGEESLIDESYSWAADQDVLGDPSSISSRDRLPSSDSLQLTIPVGVHDYATPATSEEETNEMLNFFTFEEASLPLDYEDSPLQPDFDSHASAQNSDSTLNFPANHTLSPHALDGTNLLSPASLDGSILQRRHSHSQISRPHTHHRTASGPASSMLSPDIHVKNHQRRHSHSQAVSNNEFGNPTPTSSLLSPTLTVPNATVGQLQRRHSHSAPSRRYGGEVEQPLRRSRSITSARNSSPYARPREVESGDACPSPQSESHLSPHSDTRTPEHSAPPSPRPRNSGAEDEDMFRRYDHASGVGYPILQRETIASDAVLQASAKRRKKAANYECTTCGQMLTSRDNLNSEQGA
ncbi:hypothetical protein H0H87_007976 [Tephrocybe sp. NHM501043]|nr:hypothetical protein H0H87_007976 [Tephrocybe sp. NHM501043]